MSISTAEAGFEQARAMQRQDPSRGRAMQRQDLSRSEAMQRQGQSSGRARCRSKTRRAGRAGVDSPLSDLHWSCSDVCQIVYATDQSRPVLIDGVRLMHTELSMFLK